MGRSLWWSPLVSVAGRVDLAGDMLDLLLSHVAPLVPPAFGLGKNPPVGVVAAGMFGIPARFWNLGLIWMFRPAMLLGALAFIPPML